MGKLKVLFVSADPSADAGYRLRIDEEMRAIQERVRASEYRDAVEFAFAPAARPLDLIQALNIHRPHAVHFSGHGTQQGALQFVDDDGRARPVSPALLADVFRKVRGRVRLVVLNACSSGPVAQAVTEVVDCAVGMSERVADDTAITFSAAFYGALGFALSVREAFDQGTLGHRASGPARGRDPAALRRARRGPWQGKAGDQRTLAPLRPGAGGGP